MTIFKWKNKPINEPDVAKTTALDDCTLQTETHKMLLAYLCLLILLEKYPL